VADPQRILKVEPLTSARALRGPFDYRLPRGMDAGVGSVVRIPFGRQRLLGVVVELADSSELPDSRLAEPLELLPETLPSDLVAVAVWVAREYCSTISRALQLVLPPGTMARLKRDGTLRRRRLAAQP
jgi:primosomal protein N' (replication factor Y)